MKNKKIRANCMLILAAFLWGSTFVAQSVGNDYVRPFAFQGSRCLLGAVVLLPVIAIFDRRSPDGRRWRDRTLLLGGLCCGAALFIATNLQQMGLQYTSAGKSSFITTLYIVLVPVLGLALRRRPSRWVWLSIALAVAGLYLLCVSESFSVGRGELLTLGCAFCFALHILVVDYFSPKCDGLRLSCLQFFVCGVLSLGGMALFEQPPTLQALANCWLPIAYAGVCSCAVAYTLQVLAQKNTSPTVAALLMSTESVFATLSGWLVLHERLQGKEYLGCLLMLCAVLLAQMPEKPRATEKI